MRSSHSAQEQDSERLFCDCCGKYYRSQRLLEAHQKGLDETTGKSVSCPECDKVMPKSSLRGHLQYHKSKEVRHVCHLCQKDFTKEASLRRHVLIHQVYLASWEIGKFTSMLIFSF